MAGVTGAGASGYVQKYADQINSGQRKGAKKNGRNL